jgi:hypothetical protein
MATTNLYSPPPPNTCSGINYASSINEAGEFNDDGATASYAAVLVYTRAHNTAQRQAIESLLKSWAGTADNLTGLTSYFRLDEASGIRADAMGVNTLTAINNPGSAVGKVGNAVSLNGSTQRLSRADNNTQQWGAKFSAEGWLKPSAISGDQDFLTKWDLAQQTFIFRLQNDGTVAVYISLDRTGALGIAYGVTATTLSANTWAHVAFVFDGTQSGNANRLKIYINGIAETLTFSGTIPATLSDGTSALLFGAVFPSSPADFYGGLMDEWSLWSRALSAAEVLQRKNEGDAGKTYPHILGH